MASRRRGKARDTVNTLHYTGRPPPQRTIWLQVPTVLRNPELGGGDKMSGTRNMLDKPWLLLFSVPRIFPLQKSGKMIEYNLFP